MPDVRFLCKATAAKRAVEDAERHAIPGTYLEPFALRTLGIARGAPALVAQAQERFEAMGLDWYAAQTREPGLGGSALAPS